MPPASRITDMHTCPMVTGIVPHVGGPILPPGAPTVLIDFLPAAHVTSMVTCVGPPDIIVKGSAGVFINFLPAARMGDLTAHGGVIILGSPTCIIGEIGAPSPGAAGLSGVVAGMAATTLSHPIKPNASLYSASSKAKTAPVTPVKAVPAAVPPPFDCKGNWAKTVAHTNSIANMQDPIARNKKISAEYAQIYQKNPNVKWAGLGSIVSTQAGCAMQTAQTQIDTDQQVVDADRESIWYGGEPSGDLLILAHKAVASQARDALADANQLIYRTVSPTMSFVQQYGAKQMQSCLKSGDIATGGNLGVKSVANDKVDNTKVDPQLASAVDQMAAGNYAAADDKIAQFEQISVVQDRIYDNSLNRKVFSLDQTMSNYSLGRAMGAQAPTLPLSASCNSSTPQVPFNGSITDANDRVGYYHSLMNGFNDPAFPRDQTIQQIVNQGK